jgi:hypothetical protein
MSDIEQQLRTVLQDQRWALPVPADPAAWAKAGRAPRPRRGRWRRPAAVAAAALAAAAAVLVPTALQPAGQPDAPSWQELPSPPLSPRTGAIAAWTGTEAVFLGGDTSAPCPPTASCIEPAPDQRDGAAYNPATGRWRETAPAPVRLPTHDRPPVVGDRIYILTDEAVAVRRLRRRLVEDPATAGAGRRLLVTAQSQGQSCRDPAATARAVRR